MCIDKVAVFYYSRDSTSHASVFGALKCRRETGKNGKTLMGMCLDIEDCNFQNRDKARFCAQCGIPLQGTLVQGRYEILELTAKDRVTASLQALDRHERRPVTVRVLLPKKASSAERETFLQDADLAVSLSSLMHDSGSIHVTDYGQDGPIVFLVKSEYNAAMAISNARTFKTRVHGDPSSSFDGQEAQTSHEVALSPAWSTAEQDQSNGSAVFVDHRTAFKTPVIPDVYDVKQHNPRTPIPDEVFADGDRQTHLRPDIPGEGQDYAYAAQPEMQQASATSWQHVRQGQQSTASSYNSLTVASRAYERGQYEEALHEYDVALSQNEVLVEAWSGKGATLLVLGRPEEALLAIDHALSLGPNDPDLWNSRASILHELCRFDEEMYCYDQALAHDPNFVFAWSGRGMTLAELNRPEEALAAFDRALVLDPTQSVIWQAMSDTLYVMQRYEEALIAINRALDIDATNAMLWDTKGNILRRLKAPEQALPVHEQACVLAPENATVWFDKANDLRDLRRYPEALAAYDYTLTRDPTLAGAWYNRGNVLAALRMYDDALESYEHALDYDDGLISAWYNKGSLLHELDQHTEAIAAFDRALAVDSHYIAAWNNKGLSLFALGHLDEALAALDQATSFAPEEPDAWHNKAVVLEKLGRVQEAIDCQEWARSLEAKRLSLSSLL